MNENKIIHFLEFCGSDHSDVIELIQSKNAEIERLQKLLSGAKDCIDKIEYAMDKVGTFNDRIDEALEEWNNLVKEMEESE